MGKLVDLEKDRIFLKGAVCKEELEAFLEDAPWKSRDSNGLHWVWIEGWVGGEPDEKMRDAGIRLQNDLGEFENERLRHSPFIRMRTIPRYYKWRKSQDNIKNQVLTKKKRRK